MLKHWIWLAHRSGVSDRLKTALLEHFSDPEAIYYADSGAYDHVEGLTSEAKKSLQEKDLIPAEEILDRCARKKLNILTIQDAQYPNKLKNIPDPPVVLYYKGQLPDWDDFPVIGIVGTRKASTYGLQTAKRMGYQIGKCGGVVVSGMAYGIDGLAMSGALTAGAVTVGVLGCGADIVYPLSNRALFRDVESYGCILSEFPPGTQPAKWTFPRRNRIISGLSNGVLVVEAPERSGALITARLAAEQGRDVFAVPGNVDQSGCLGSNRLLKDGAMVAMDGWDVIGEYEALYPGKIRKDTRPSHMHVYPQEVAAEKREEKVAQKPEIPKKKSPLQRTTEKIIIDIGEPSPYSDVNKAPPKLSEEEQKVYDALRNGPRLVDDVIAETGLTTGKILGLLTMMELKGHIKRLPGKQITLKK